MKKLLAILASGLVVSSAPLSVVSCNSGDSSTKVDPKDAAVLNNINNESAITFSNSDESQPNYVPTFKDISADKINSIVVNDLQLNSELFSNYKIVNENYVQSSKSFALGAGKYTYSIEKLSTKKNLVDNSGNTVFNITIKSNDLNTYNQVLNDFDNFSNKVSNGQTLDFSNLSLGNIIDGIGLSFNISNLKDIITKAVPMLGQIINLKFSDLINLVVPLINKPDLSALNSDVSAITTLNPKDIATSKEWNNFCTDLQKLLNDITLIGGHIDFNSPIEVNATLPEVKLLGTLYIDPLLAIKHTTVKALLTAIAPDIIHFLNYCNYLAQNYQLDEINYTLVAMQYLLSPTTLSFASSNSEDKIMSNVNQDMVTSGRISTNLDNLLFDFFGNVIIPSKSNDSEEKHDELKAWHDNDNNYSDPGLSLAVTILLPDSGVQDRTDPWDAWNDHDGLPYIPDPDADESQKGWVIPGLNIYYGYYDTDVLIADPYAVSNPKNDEPEKQKFDSVIVKNLINFSSLLKSFWEQSFFNIVDINDASVTNKKYWDLFNSVDIEGIKDVLGSFLGREMVDELWDIEIVPEINSFLDKFIPQFDFTKGLDISYMYKMLITSNNLFSNSNNINLSAFNMGQIKATVEVEQNGNWITSETNDALWNLFLDTTKTKNFRIKINNLDFSYEVNNEQDLIVSDNLSNFYFGQ